MVLFPRPSQHEIVNSEDRIVTPPSSTLDKESEDLCSGPAAREPYAAYDNSPYPLLTWRVVMMGILVSMGKLIRRLDLGYREMALTNVLMT
jgi:hypothetical protein